MALEDLDCFTVLHRIYVEHLLVARGTEINWKLVNPSLPRKTAAHCARLCSEKILPKSDWDRLGVYPPLPHCLYHAFCAGCFERELPAFSISKDLATSFLNREIKN